MAGLVLFLAVAFPAGGALASGATVTGWTWQPGGGGGLVVTVSPGGAHLFPQLPSSLWPSATGAAGSDEALLAYLGAGSPYDAAVRAFFAGSSLSAAAIVELRADPGFDLAAVGAPSLTLAHLNTGVVLGDPATYPHPTPAPAPFPRPRVSHQPQPNPVQTSNSATVQAIAPAPTVTTQTNPVQRIQTVKKAPAAQTVKSSRIVHKTRLVRPARRLVRRNVPARTKIVPSPVTAGQPILGGGFVQGIVRWAVPAAVLAGAGIGLGGLFLLVRRVFRSTVGQSSPVGGAAGGVLPGTPPVEPPASGWGHPSRPIPPGKPAGRPEVVDRPGTPPPSGSAAAPPVPGPGLQGGNRPAAVPAGGAIDWEIDEDNL